MTNRLTASLGSFLISSITALALGASSATSAQPDKPKPEKIDWGKEVNGLAVSIAPAKDEGKFVLRWRNVGKATLELPWVRFNSDAIYKSRDDLLGHVHLKNADGKLTPARTYKFPIIGGPPYRPRTVILDPDKVHEETIDLWTYVEKQAGGGRYQLSIELEIRTGYAPSRKDVKYWTGKVQSNVLDVKLAPKAEGRTEPGKADEKKAEDGFISLLNGKSFAGWKIVGAKGAGKAWAIHQNAIVKGRFQSMLVCAGQPSSCMVTDKTYKNYILRFDWQFGGGEAKELKNDTDYEGDGASIVCILSGFIPGLADPRVCGVAVACGKPPGGVSSPLSRPGR
jgi:hypothetical protein